MIYTTQSLEETQCLAKEIARNLSGRSTIFFMEGEMGAGKTTFAHFLAKEINGQKISSSSFGLVNVYNGDRIVVHCDFYRQHWDHEFYETEILEHLDSSSVLILEFQLGANLITRRSEHHAALICGDP